MYGHPRQHIWTFASGATENLVSISSCPCDMVIYLSHHLLEIISVSLDMYILGIRASVDALYRDGTGQI